MLRKKQFFTVLIIFLLAVCSGWALAGTYSGGTGEPNDPYRIATPEDMQAIGANPDDWDKHFILVNDINLADYTGTQFNIIGTPPRWPEYAGEPFTGVFDGNGYAIRNFTYTSPESAGVGLFVYVDSDGKIINLALEDVNIDAGNGSSVGSLVVLNYGMLSNCRVTGSVRAAVGLGGLVAHNGGTISECSVAVMVKGGRLAGGLAASNNIYSISNCHATGTVSGLDTVGGLVGRNEMGAISNCYATGAVTGDDDVGGLVGYSHYGTISNSYSRGGVSADVGVGGLVGDNDTGNITNCYAVGPVDGNDKTGGLVGHNFCGKVSNCYAAGSVSGNTDTGGFVGYEFVYPPYCYSHYTVCFWDKTLSPSLEGIGNTSDPNVIGKPTTEMQQESTFTYAGWDFIEIWDIGENQTYPFLRQYSAGDINHDRQVNFLDFAILASHWLEDNAP